MVSSPVYLITIALILAVVSAQKDEISPETNDGQITLLLDQMHTLTAANTKMLSQMNELQGKMIAQTDKVIQLQGQMNYMKTENAKLVKQVHYGNYEKSKLMNKLAKMEEGMSTMKAENSKLHDDMADMTLHLNALHNTNTSFAHERTMNHVSYQENFVSFTALASQDVVVNDGQRLPFDQVLRNYGGSYNPSESQFVCPVKGYYLFQVSVRSFMNYSMYAGIFLDSEFLVLAIGDDVDGYDQGSNMVVTLCDVGQVVEVLVTCCGTNGMQGGGPSSFTGVLLRIA